MFSYDLQKMTFPKGLFVFVLFLSSLIAPFWYIYQFCPAIYERSDLTRLFLICLAIGGPIVLFNLFIEVVIFFKEEEKAPPDKRNKGDLFFILRTSIPACYNTFIVLYLPIALSFFTGHIILRKAIWISIITQILLFFITLIIGQREMVKDSQKEVKKEEA